MSPNWNEVESLASQVFIAARQRIANDHHLKQNQLLMRLQSTRNGNEFMLALRKGAIEEVQETILAQADALVHAYDRFESPASDEAEHRLVKFARICAEAGPSQLRCWLRSLNPKIVALVGEPGIDFDQEVRQVVPAALAEGRRRLREQKSRSSQKAGNAGELNRNTMSVAPAVQEHRHAARESDHLTKPIKTTLGQNIDLLRRECGWSFEELALKTGFDKKAIIGHVNHGKGAYPRTRKIYADTLAIGLGRKVTVAELEGRAGSPPL